MEEIKPSIRWNLNNLLYGLDIEKLNNYLVSLKERLIEFEEYSKTSTLDDEVLMAISQMIKQIESVESFYYCLTTEDIAACDLTALNGSIAALKSQVRIILSNLRSNLKDMSEKQFTDWSSNISEKNFLEALLKDELISSKEEKIISNLVNETLSGLEDLYGQIRNKLKVKVEANEVSFAEASNLSVSHPDQHKRHYIFRELNKTFEVEKNIFASYTIKWLELDSMKIKY